MHTKLGQKKYCDFQSDIDLVEEICTCIKDRLAAVRTPEFRNLLEMHSADLKDAVNNCITDVQHALKRIVDLQNFGTSCPDFARGAYVFVNKEVAGDMEETLKGQVASEYTVYVSPEYKGYIDAALGQTTWDLIDTRMSGSKQPKIKQQSTCDICPMARSFAAYCMKYYHTCRKLPVRPAGMKPRECHSTGSLPDDENERQKAWGRAAYKSFQLMEKPAEVGRDSKADKEEDGNNACGNAGDDAGNADEEEDGDNAGGNAGDDAGSAPDDAPCDAFSQGLDAMSNLDGSSDRVNAQIEVLLLEVDEECSVKRLPKNAPQFADYVSNCLCQLPEQILMPLTKALDIEKEIELVLREDSEHASDRTKDAFKKLLNLVRRCFQRDVMMGLLLLGQVDGAQRKSQDGLKRAVAESMEMFIPSFERELLDNIEKIQKKEWKAVRKMLPSLMKNGPANIAYQLSETFLEIGVQVVQMSDAKLRQLAHHAWNAQAERHREHEKEEAKKRPRSTVRTKLNVISDGPAWFAEESRRHKEAGGGDGRYEYAVKYP